MHQSRPIEQRLLGEDAESNVNSRSNVIFNEGTLKQKQVAVIERNHCCQGSCRKFSSGDCTVLLIFLGVLLMSLAYFFLRIHKHEIKPIL